MITTVITSPGGFNAFGVLVRWQSTDEEILSLLDPTMMSLKSTGSSQGPEATNSSIPSSPSAAVSVSSTSMMMTLPPNTPSATISKGSTAFETTISSPTSSASLILNGFAYTSEPTEPLQKTQTIDKLQILGTAGTSMTSGTSEAMPSTTTGLSENTTIYLGVSIPLVAAMIFALCIFRRSYQRRQAIIAGTPSNSSFANHGIRPGELFELRSEARELREPFELHNEPRGPFELHNGTISPNEMEGQSAFLIELYGERGLAR
ncbi:MAG: hypothetical protein MMC33_002050 [Icmadophila ericetorum]|nr:hypothetical protein [Icmadophila ericetorum]